MAILAKSKARKKGLKGIGLVQCEKKSVGYVYPG